MKTLVFIRHAKSSWDNPDFSDFERPLNERGLLNAPFMAEKLTQLITRVDLIISSPATRAITTAKIFADKFNIKHEQIIQDKGIYDNGFKHIVKVIDKLNNSLDCVFIVGHNPDISTLATYFSGEYIQNIPTCGIVCIDFRTHNWNEVASSSGKLRFYDYPKNHV